MTWSVSRDVHAFLAAAGDFLAAHPVDNTMLLTEAAYLAARPSASTDQLYGWWQPPGGGVGGAFLQAFAAACIAAKDVAHDVLVFAPAADIATDIAYQRLGFEPVLQRVMLGI